MYLSQKQDGQIKDETTKEAKPSTENAMKYFTNTSNWAKQKDIKLFYFSSCDGLWKVRVESELGARSGIWDKDEKLKYS